VRRARPRLIAIALVVLGSRLAALPAAIVALECAMPEIAPMPPCCAHERPGAMCPMHRQALTGQAAGTFQHECRSEVSILSALLGLVGDLGPRMPAVPPPAAGRAVVAVRAPSPDFTPPPSSPPPRA
jgi:hypothetical protein